MKTVLITGGTRGIGRETAGLFYKKGFNVAVSYNKRDDLAKTLLDEFPKMLAIKADVSDENQVKAMVERVISTFGSPDVLVNNAGISQQKLLTDTSTEEWLNMINVNLNSLYYTCKYVVPYMVNKKQGSIVNVSSVWGVTGASMEVCYSASKGGVIAFTKALSKELAPSNIRVNAVAPGVIATDMCNFDEETMALIKEEIPLGKTGTPSDVAESIYFLAGDKGGYITGQVLSPNGGMVI